MVTPPARTCPGASAGLRRSASGPSIGSGASGSPARSASAAASARSPSSSPAPPLTARGSSSGGVSHSCSSRANRGPLAAMSARTTSTPCPGK